jgi:hypothetical protein
MCASLDSSLPVPVEEENNRFKAMHRSQFFAVTGVFALALSATVYSQAPAAPGVPAAPAAQVAPAVRPAAPATVAQPSIDTRRILQQLQAMKAQNAATLEKQNALLLKLDDLQKEAAQLKIFSKRG